MTMKSPIRTAVLVSFTAFAAIAAAQEPPAPADRAAQLASPPVPLSVQVVLTRQAGGQKIASLPYTMTVTAGRHDWARLRMGVEVPVVTSTIEAAPKSVQYRSVGVNLDCMADRLEDGRYGLSLTIEQSSIYVPEEQKRGGAEAPLAAQPMFRTFKTTVNPVLRDGQTQLFTVATDPVSGEQTRVEVTLNVMK